MSVEPNCLIWVTGSDMPFRVPSNMFLIVTYIEGPQGHNVWLGNDIYGNRLAIMRTHITAILLETKEGLEAMKEEDIMESIL